MDRTKQSCTMSVFMLPYLAYGHISPYLELAKKLTERNFYIYLCSTPINLSFINKKITDERYSRSIELVEFHLPSSPDLPPHRHTTNGLPLHLTPTLEKAFTTASPGLFDILKTLAPDLVIYDYNQPWAPTIAAACDIPAVEFLTIGATMASLGLHMFKKPGVEFPFPAIRLQKFHETQFRASIEFVLSKDDGKEGALQAVERSRDVILINTSRELEGKYVDYFSSLVEKKIIPVGPLAQDIANDKEDGGDIMRWLDGKEEKSTVFVAFGSEYYLSKEQMEEVAYGLELSKVNFIWVVRFPAGENVKVEEALPEGFLHRVRERGLVVENWAPQAKILAHSSTGGFVSHCGWNSIMESLKLGVPIIALPMHLDQPPNARLVEEIGVGVEVSREEDGRLDREEIAQVIRKVVVDKNGEDVRIKAREFSENIRVKREEGIDEAVEELLQVFKERKSLKN